MTDPTVQRDPRKIRLGLILISLMFVAAVVLFVVVDDPIGRAIFFAAAVLALVRGYLLVRWLRRDASTAA